MNPIARKDGRISSQLHCEKRPLEAVYKVNWDAVVDKQNKGIGVSEHLFLVEDEFSLFSDYVKSHSLHCLGDVFFVIELNRKMIYYHLPLYFSN
jgi:hypothetical protein